MNPRVTLPEEMWKRLQQKCFGVVNLRAWIAGSCRMGRRPGDVAAWVQGDLGSGGMGDD